MNTLQIEYPDGSKQTVPYGTRVNEIIENSYLRGGKDDFLAVLVNNEPASLSYKVEVNARIRPVTAESFHGVRIYRNSLCFLLAIAAYELMPEKRLVIGHSLGKGYFYYLDSDIPITGDEIGRLDKRMREIVEADIPIVRRVVSYEEALGYFERIGYTDTKLLLEFRNESKVPVYQCGEYYDLSHGPLAPRTGILKYYQIMPYPPGFLLRYPGAGSPKKIEPFRDNPVLFSVYTEYKAWGRILDITGVGKLNQKINDGEISEFINVAEALHVKMISEIADKILDRISTVKVILIAGPSSSGKTTFTKKLAIQLKVVGLQPLAISLDDYFLSRERTPRDKYGNYDFEALEAIDVDLLNSNLIDLFNGRETQIPVFDFKSGSRKPEGRSLKLGERSILLIEGIHGLNPELTPRITVDNKYLIYVSALTQLNLDDHNRIPTTDNRLIRRMVRDNQFRSHSALKTLTMWRSVRRGEARNIFPYQNNADSAFNSALDYELSVLKVYAEPLLRTIKPYHEEYAEATRLLRFLDNFLPITPRYVPKQSILREFIGESDFKY